MSNEPVRRCPLCASPAVHAYRPFCSRACRDRDLNAWFDEVYRLPAHPAQDDDRDSAQPLPDTE